MLLIFGQQFINIALKNILLINNIIFSSNLKYIKDFLKCNRNLYKIFVILIKKIIKIIKYK